MTTTPPMHYSPTPPLSPPSSHPPTPLLSDLPVQTDPEPYDLLGIGFGPTHLALAIAFEEEHPGKRAVFVEAKDGFSWHPALLLPASRMQISFLKDLATFRNPQSTYSFISYLHSHGLKRLVGFSNIGSWTPSRAEWAGYLAWAATRLGHLAAYSNRVLSVQPMPSVSGSAKILKVTCLDATTNTLHVRYTRNLSVGTGATPVIPSLFKPLTLPAGGEGFVAHTSDYLPTLRRIFGSDEGDLSFSGRFAVVGGGQSCAEVFNDLLSRYPRASVDMIHRSSALVPADDSPFVNARAFDPASTDEFHALPVSDRLERLHEFKRANYSCIAPELLESMYKTLYRQRVQSDASLLSPNSPPPAPTHRILANSHVTSCVPLQASKPQSGEPTVSLTVSSLLPSSSSSTSSTENYTAVFLGTGYHRPPSSLSFLSSCAPYLPTLSSFLNGSTPAEHQLVQREHYLPPASDGAWKARVFVLGFNEKSHGLSDGLLSVGAVRAGEVARALTGMKEDGGVPAPA